MPIPASRASRGVANATCAPLTLISPESGITAPARIFIAVDLPAALSPTRPSTSPGRTRIVTPRSASIIP
jgi:hypothetical protein